MEMRMKNLNNMYKHKSKGRRIQDLKNFYLFMAISQVGFLE